MPAPGVPSNAAKATAYGYLQTTDGSTLAGYIVSAVLVYDGMYEGAFLLDGLIAIPKTITCTSAITTGLWSMELYGNDRISPAGTRWYIVQRDACLARYTQLAAATSINIGALVSDDLPPGGSFTPSLQFPTVTDTTPVADRILFYDYSAGRFTYLAPGAGLSITGTTLNATAGLTVGTTTIAGGTTGRVLYDNAGVVGELDLSAVYQAKDATLTAFAALTIAANTLTIGTGTDAFAQTTFAANTFPGRASTGNLVSQVITDFALTILDDADAATVRATIGAGAVPVPPDRVVYLDVNGTAMAALGFSASTTLFGAATLLAALSPAVDASHPAALIVGAGSFGDTATPLPAKGLGIDGLGCGVSNLGQIQLADSVDTTFSCHGITFGVGAAISFTNTDASAVAQFTLEGLCEVVSKINLPGSTTNAQNKGWTVYLTNGAYIVTANPSDVMVEISGGAAGVTAGDGGLLYFQYGSTFIAGCINAKGGDGDGVRAAGSGGQVFAYDGSSIDANIVNVSPGTDNGGGAGSAGVARALSSRFAVSTLTGVASITGNGVTVGVTDFLAAKLNGNTITAGTGTLTLSTFTLTATATGTVYSTGNPQTTISGNAATATALQTARTINGTSFNGTANITVTAAASTLTGTTLASNVVTSSLTTIGTLVAGAVPTTLLTGTITNAQLAGSIAYSKLSLTGAILNADLAGSIDGGKISGGTLGATAGTNLTGTAASLTAGNVTTNANLTGPVTSIGNATTITAASVTNAMLAGSIAYSKLSLTGAILNADLAGSIAYSKLSLTGAILNADLAGSIDGGKISGGTFGAVNGSALTALTAANITASTAGGRSTLNIATPASASFLQISSGGVASTRTFAQTLSDIGAQASGSYAASGANSDITSLTGALTAITGAGLTITGDVASGGNLILVSTTHATKGKIYFGAGLTSAYDGVNDRIGIGTASPSSKLTVGSPTAAGQTEAAAAGVLISMSTTGVQMVLENTSTAGSGAGAGFEMLCNSGAAMASGNRIGTLLWTGSSSASALRATASISAFTDQLWVDASAYGSSLRFFVTANGATSRVERMRLHNSGGLSVNNTTDPGAGVVSATSFTGAGTGLTGTAASLTVGNVTTNANLTGDVTSAGNATTLANIPAISGVNLTNLNATNLASGNVPDARNTVSNSTTTTLSALATIGGLTTVTGTGAMSFTGGAGNSTFTAGTGNSRTITFRTTTSGGTATNALILDAAQEATVVGNRLFLANNSNLYITGSGGNIDVNNVSGSGKTRLYGTTIEFRASGLDPAVTISSAGAVAMLGTLAVTGNTTLGTGTAIKNIRHGVSGVMVAGAVTVTDTGCTANTRYFFAAHTLGTITIPGGYYASTRTASTSFVITSSQLTETSTIDWVAVEP